MSENIEGTARIDWTTVLPKARDAMVQLEAVAHHAGIPRDLLELVKIRVS